MLLVSPAVVEVGELLSIDRLDMLLSKEVLFFLLHRVEGHPAHLTVVRFLGFWFGNHRCTECALGGRSDVRAVRPSEFFSLLGMLLAG